MILSSTASKVPAGVVTLPQPSTLTQWLID